MQIKQFLFEQLEESISNNLLPSMGFSTEQHFQRISFLTEPSYFMNNRELLLNTKKFLIGQSGILEFDNIDLSTIQYTQGFPYLSIICEFE